MISKRLDCAAAARNAASVMSGAAPAPRRRRARSPVRGRGRPRRAAAGERTWRDLLGPEGGRDCRRGEPRPRRLPFLLSAGRRSLARLCSGRNGSDGHLARVRASWRGGAMLTRRRRRWVRARGNGQRWEMTVREPTLEPHAVQLHGHQVTYRTAGDGPVLLLLHGVTNTSQTWEPVAAELQPLVHADRARPARPRRIRDAARRLFAGRACERRPRPPQPARARARDRRRPLARRRHRDGLQPTSSPSAASASCSSPAAGWGAEVHLLLRAAALPGADYVLPLITSRRCSAPAAASAASCSACGSRPAAISRSSRRASPRSTTAGRARRSCTRSAR